MTSGDSASSRGAEDLGPPETPAPDAAVPGGVPARSTVPGELTRTRRVRLREEEWAQISWRRRPSPLPPVRPFDRSACLTHATALRTPDSRRSREWLGPQLSRQEVCLCLQLPELLTPNLRFPPDPGERIAHLQGAPPGKEPRQLQEIYFVSAHLSPRMVYSKTAASGSRTLIRWCSARSCAWRRSPPARLERTTARSQAAALL